MSWDTFWSGVGNAIGQFADDAYNSLFPSAANRKMAATEMEYNTNEAKKAREHDLQLQHLQYGQNVALQNQQLNNQLMLDNAARDWQSRANQIAMDFSAKEAEAQRQFQADMSNTAHQRQMADLQAAGLNPILAASYGGASVPNGASGTGFSTSVGSGNASSASVGLPSTSSNARAGSHIQGGRSIFDNVSALVGDYLHNAKEINEEVKKFNASMKKDLLGSSFKTQFLSKQEFLPPHVDSDDFFDLAVKHAAKVLFK